MSTSSLGQFSITYFDNYNYNTEQWDGWQSSTTPLDAWDAKYLPTDSTKTVFTAHAFLSVDMFDLRGDLWSQDEPPYGPHETGGEDWNPLRSFGDDVSGQSPCHVFAALFTGLVYLEAGDELELQSDDDAYVYLDDETMWGDEILYIDHINFFETIEPYEVPAALAGYHRLTVKFAERQDVHSGIQINCNDEPLVAVRQIGIDIKPGSYPNCFNVNGSGVIPVAILGSADFDVTQIDLDTLWFGGLEVRVNGKKPQCSFEDVSGDFSLSPEGAPDGYLDLVCHFVDDAGSWSSGGTTATLGGCLLGEFGVTRFAGVDEICIRPPAPSAPPADRGTILREVWEGVPGVTVADLTADPDYPDNPSLAAELESFEAPTDWADNYGTRIHGYLHPEASGDYIFWIASDDHSELWLSPDDNPVHAIMIANVPGWTPPRDFDNTGGGEGDADAQQSDPIALEAGQTYYIMALHKEGGGGDNLAVAWEGPDCPTRDIIRGFFLSPANY
jgi:hypothetical protein